MTLFLDSANLEEIRKAMSWGVISGVTTNQKILLKSGVTADGYKQTIREICELVDGPVSVELTETRPDIDLLVSEAEELAGIHKWVNVKVPMWGDGRGLEVVSRLWDIGIKTNATCMMSAAQGILAMEAGAKYLSLFYRRMIDTGGLPYAKAQFRILSSYLKENHSKSRIIAGSIRKPEDVVDSWLAGAHVVTVPYKIMKRLPFHPRTESTIAEFDEAWRKLRGRDA